MDFDHDGPVQSFHDYSPPTIPIEITAETGGLYSWHEAFHEAKNVSRADWSSKGLRSGTATSYPAIEVTGNTSVPIGTIRLATYDCEQESWLFEYESGSPVSGTGNDDPLSPDPITFNISNPRLTLPLPPNPQVSFVFAGGTVVLNVVSIQLIITNLQFLISGGDPQINLGGFSIRFIFQTPLPPLPPGINITVVLVVPGNGDLKIPLAGNPRRCCTKNGFWQKLGADLKFCATWPWPLQSGTMPVSAAAGLLGPITSYSGALNPSSQINIPAQTVTPPSPVDLAIPFTGDGTIDSDGCVTIPVSGFLSSPLLPPLPLSVFMAEITGVDTFTAGKRARYSWKHVWDKNVFPAPAYPPQQTLTRVGTATSFPALEKNDNPSVPIGAIVELNIGDGNYYVFEYGIEDAVVRLASGTQGFLQRYNGTTFIDVEEIVLVDCNA